MSWVASFPTNIWRPRVVLRSMDHALPAVRLGQLLGVLTSFVLSQATLSQEAAKPQAPASPSLPATLLLAAHGHDDRAFVVVGGEHEEGPAVLWRTTDGGRTFSVPAMPVVAARLYDVRFTSSELGFACGLQSSLLRTRDGGATWQSVHISGPTAWLTAVDFVDAEHGVVSGAREGPLLLWTEDGGRTWTEAAMPERLPAGARDVRDVLMLDRMSGFACGGDGLLLRTVDGGRSWQRLESGSTAWLRHLSFPDAQHGFVVAGDGQVLASTDGGVTWEKRGKVAGKANSIAFASATRGYVVTMDGVLYESDDGGRTFAERWRQDGHLCDVATFGSGKTLCVGDGGLIRWLE